MATITKKLSEISSLSREKLERIDAISDEDIDFLPKFPFPKG